MTPETPIIRPGVPDRLDYELVVNKKMLDWACWYDRVAINYHQTFSVCVCQYANGSVVGRGNCSRVLRFSCSTISLNDSLGTTAMANNTFDEDLFVKGLEQRKSTLGKEYVEKNLAAADDFTRPFQEAMTAWCWGFGWGDEAIDPKTRSMMNLAMIGALGRMHEWEIHCRGALNNGVSKEEIRAIVHVVGIYCGVPMALECFRVARKVLEEEELL